MACDQEMGGRTITLDFGSAGMSVKSAPRVMVLVGEQIDGDHFDGVAAGRERSHRQIALDGELLAAW